MEKKGDPQYVRFLPSTKKLIDEISTLENQEFSDAADMLAALGAQFYSLVHRNFGLRPKFRTNGNGSEEGGR